MGKKKDLDEALARRGQPNYTQVRMDEMLTTKDLRSEPVEQRGLKKVEQHSGFAPLRRFATGATRSPLGNKPQYEGYLNPLVLKRFAEYMKKHQTQSDGQQREADNWQKGIPLDSLHDSKVRHDLDVWLHHRGYESEATENLQESLCACLFNTMAILLQVLQKERV